jgi:hypothetical protein
MYRDDIPKDKVEYIQECPCCYMTTLVLANKWNSPEYETDVYVQCQCGEFLEFVLPVN